MEKKITYDRDGVYLEVVVSSATMAMGVTRTILEKTTRENAEIIKDYNDVVQVAKRISVTLMYPNLIAAVVSKEGFDSWPPSYEEFLNLPDVFVQKWEEMVFHLNPHWRPMAELSEDQKKIIKERSINSIPD